jgi:diacylglycerol kinase (ATP)
MATPNERSRRVHAILNRTARGFRRDPSLVDRIGRALGATAVVHGTRDLEELDRAARSIVEGGASLVVLGGGDGTFMAGASALARHLGDDVLPPLALLPMGTVGRLAVSLGVAGQPETLAARYGALGPDAHLATQPSLRVQSTGPAGARTARIGFIFGTGLVARFFDVYEERGAGGVLDAARIVAHTFASSLRGGAFAKRVLDPLPCRLEVDGHPLEPEAWSLVCAAVVRDLGLGMRVTYRAGEDPSRVHLVAHALPPSVLGPRVGRVLLGRTIANEGERGFDGLASSFRVTFDGEGPWVLDGDRFRDREVEVTAGPVLRIAVP